MTSDALAKFASQLGASLKSIVKMAVQSRRPGIRRTAAPGDRIIVMGNGPSLAKAIDEHADVLRRGPAMAVNFAANAPQFADLKPSHYILADPHFFAEGDPNVARLWRNLAAVTWPMTLYLPAGSRPAAALPANVAVERYNPVGVEGFDSLCHAAYAAGRGMPRPRNVLIPAIMAAMLAGYRTIDIVGADHSWSTSLWVDDENNVVTVQPHFYDDNDKERERVRQAYRGVRLHDIMLSFHIAFKAYHDVERYARSRGVDIYNCTPGSFIDAFRRRPLQ